MSKIKVDIWGTKYFAYLWLKYPVLIFKFLFSDWNCKTAKCNMCASYSIFISRGKIILNNFHKWNICSLNLNKILGGGVPPPTTTIWQSVFILIIKFACLCLGSGIALEYREILICLSILPIYISNCINAWTMATTSAFM